MTRTGRPDGQLVVIRGNSRSGKSSLARTLRERPMSVVGQDHLRRIILKERDTRDNRDILDLIDLTVRFCLDRGRDVVLEGILFRPKYGELIERLLADHRGGNHVYYLRADFEETVRRHEASPDAAEWTRQQMSEWWAGDDVLDVPGEQVLDTSLGPERIAAHIAADLDRVAAR